MATRSRTARRMPSRQRVWARQIGTMSPLANARAQASLDTQFATEYGTTRLPVGTTVAGLLVQFATTQLIDKVSSTDTITMGIGLFDETTATETPDPLDSPHSDWMWRLQMGHEAGADASQSTFTSLGGPIRVKAMRKVSELNVRPWFIVRLAGNTTVDISYDISLMLLLP